MLLTENTDRPRQFAILINAWCHDNPILKGCFGAVADFTELLVPYDIMEKDNFLDMLHNTPYITQEDYRNPELIGWLYQFYISEKKDEVFAKKGKFEADDIPAATQIFTPNWIVRYLVQNTVGRMYLDNHPEAGHLAERWSYLTPDSQPQTGTKPIYEIKDLKKLRMADLACGSGHILNVGFDLYMDLYKEEYVSRPAAAERILRNNLVGIDIDDRARQLAMFSLTLKACQYAPGMEKRFVRPNVMSLPKPYDEELYGPRENTLHQFFQGLEREDTMEEVNAAYDLLDEGKSLGSIMKIKISNPTRIIITQALEFWETREDIPEAMEMQFMAMRVILFLSQTYSVIVMNPPYMGTGNMNQVLSKYVKENYEEGKADLATVFVQMASERLESNGKYGFIVPPSWMFLSTFEKLRRNIIDNQSINSLLHLSRGVFGADFGASAAVIQKTQNPNATGTYFRLIERTFQEFEADHLRMLFEQTMANHDFKFKFADYTKDAKELACSENGNRIFYGDVPQSNFEKIPGSPIGYWVSEILLMAFSKGNQLNLECDTKKGLATSDNNRFLRLWYEVSVIKSSLRQPSRRDVKWYPHNKGGQFRRWYGNNEYVINWDNNGFEIRNYKDTRGKLLSRPQNLHYNFKQAITWSKIASGDYSARLCYGGYLFDDAAAICYNSDLGKLKYIIGFLNSKVANTILKCINPTLNIQIGDIGAIPVIYGCIKHEIIDNCLTISKLDWDSHETSWDFQSNELVTIAATYRDAHPEMEDFVPHTDDDFNLMAYCYQQYVQHWTELFHQLHTNEETLNKQFIEIYGLQDELTPDVPLSEVTILQQGEITIENDQVVFHSDVVMKQFISYLVGLSFGRYRLDKPGLHIAHPKPTEEETAPYTYRGVEVAIAPEPMIPMLPEGAPYSDNLQNRILRLCAAIFGPNQRDNAIRFIQDQLGKSLEDYLAKDFWKDHKKMYKNRPIYWLFASSKGHFRCLTYMHRMNEFTAHKIYREYVTTYIGHLRNHNLAIQHKAGEPTAHERKIMQQNDRAIADCEQYSFRLLAVAQNLDRTRFDLDDGFVHNYAKYGDIVAKI